MVNDVSKTKLLFSYISSVVFATMPLSNTRNAHKNLVVLRNISNNTMPPTDIASTPIAQHVKKTVYHNSLTFPITQIVWIWMMSLKKS